MIQLAKCFHSIYRLQSVSKYNKNEKVFGFKGSAIHLPLPHQGTLNRVNETPPSTNSLNIIIDYFLFLNLKIVLFLVLTLLKRNLIF
jgi:hypothetical protein